MSDIQPTEQNYLPSVGLQPSFRSGAVARMAGLPVATLRIWEQRYQAIRPTTAPSGHRLYSLADVERVSLLRRLTQQGHAISLLASLNNEQMHALSLTLAQSQADSERKLESIVVESILTESAGFPDRFRFCASVCYHHLDGFYATVIRHGL